MTTNASTLTDALIGHQYLNLETFRRSGVGVRTPVWFAEDQGRLYVRTQADSGKVKRIRHQARVRLVPSDAQGKPKGEWIEAHAQLAPPEQADLAQRLFRKKYGLQLRGFEAMMKLRGGSWATIRIDPPTPRTAGEDEK
jgi:PPOX class probable F420-dependent enzyme